MIKHKQRCDNGCINYNDSPRHVKILVGADYRCEIVGMTSRDLTDERLSIINERGCASYTED